MGLLTRFFGGKKPENPQSTGFSEFIEPGIEGMQIMPSSREPMLITPDILQRLFPIRNLDDEVLEAFSVNRVAEVFGPGTVLFHLGDTVRQVHYLLEGVVTMDVGGQVYEVSADTAKARFPLCCGKQFTATAEAKTDVQVLRVSAKIMSQGAAGNLEIPHALDANVGDIPEAVRDSRLFQAFSQYYRDEELQLPSLPEVATKLGRAIQEEVSLAEIAKIVQLDPVIATKLVHIANSPLYLPRRPIVTCLDAVTRLGLVATRNLVTSFSLKHIFKCKDPQLAKFVQTQWRQSIYLSALCYVLATDNPGLNPEEALFAGLIADIGVVPFLYFADHLPREFWQPEDIEAVVPHVRGPVGTYLLKRWDFPPELSSIPLLAEDWYHDSGERLTLADIVILSKLHAYVGTPRMMALLPAITSIPACGKLKDRRLSPAYSLNVLHEAKDAIALAMKFFEG
jgi:HD-like signal output (HDOD) protein